MLVDLVFTMTADGIRLDGALHSPQAKPRDEIATKTSDACDAIVCLHGTGSNFYNATVFAKLTPAWLERGISVLWGNTRGHDGISTAYTARGGKRQGAAYERFAESHHDVHAWVEALRKRGFQRIAVVGHSAGAVKLIHTLARYPHPDIHFAVAVSPPRMSYSHYVQSARQAEFLDNVRRAEALVAANEPAMLIEVNIPLTYVVTPASYLEKYGRDEAFNVLNLLPDVRSPLLVTFGSQEVEKEVAFQGLPAAIAAIDPSQKTVAVATVEGADHLYSGKGPELGAVIEKWLAQRANT